MSYTHLNPGVELEISGHVWHGENKTGVAELVALSVDELRQLEKDSMEKEDKIFQAMCDLLPDWTAQADMTVSIRDAMTYLKTRPVEHTANQWITKDSSVHEISNMVYKMTWRVYERTRWNRATQRSDVEAWELSWYVTFNTVQNPDSTHSGRQIAGQSGKVFKDKADMDKYLQGRIAAYAHLFTELSPPIPKGQESRFSVNGVLLPGYAVEVTVDDLLAYLDENDGKETPTPLPPSAPKKSLAHKHKKHVPTR